MGAHPAFLLVVDNELGTSIRRLQAKLVCPLLVVEVALAGWVYAASAWGLDLGIAQAVFLDVGYLTAG